MGDRRTQEIKERYLKRITQEVLDTLHIIKVLSEENTKNKQWFIDWKNNLNEILK